MLDEEEFLSPYGICSLSRCHAEHPFVFRAGDQEYRVSYLPAESDTGMFGGNSNWRGPISMPVNGLIIRALLQYYGYYGDDFTIECPTGSGRQMNLYQVAEEISRPLTSPNTTGLRPQPNSDSNDEYQTRNIEFRSRIPEIFTSTVDILHSIFCGSFFKFYANCGEVTNIGSNGAGPHWRMR
jgi:hypothetical protein